MERSEKVERYYAEDHHFSKAIGILRDLALKKPIKGCFLLTG